MRQCYHPTVTAVATLPLQQHQCPFMASPPLCISSSIKNSSSSIILIIILSSTTTITTTTSRNCSSNSSLHCAQCQMLNSLAHPTPLPLAAAFGGAACTSYPWARGTKARPRLQGVSSKLQSMSNTPTPQS